jgi:hypothetical protein
MAEHAWHAKRFEDFSFSVIVSHVAAFMEMRLLSRTASFVGCWRNTDLDFASERFLETDCY